VPYHNTEVTVANKARIRSIEMGTLRIPAPAGDILVPSYVFPDEVLSNNLASLSYLCNHGCIVTLSNTEINTHKDGTLVWHGPKAPHDKLWNLDLADIILHQHPTTQAGTAFQTIKLDTDAECVAFTHAVLAGCPISTMIKAVEKGWLSNYPKLTAKMIRTNLPVSRATAMGYLDQTRQGQHSTHPSQPKP
jgi:hypothetical protein